MTIGKKVLTNGIFAIIIYIYYYYLAEQPYKRSVMRLKTRVFELNHYHNLSELARAMEISVSQIYRVQEGKRNINGKFIIGAMRAFPGYKFDDLFYLDSTPSMPSSKRAANGKQGMESTECALESLVSATEHI